jgi:hypothetical protein
MFAELSALGQSQTFDDVCIRPLSPQLRTHVRHRTTSAICQKQTFMLMM